jgi:hypothetical protein
MFYNNGDSYNARSRQDISREFQNSEAQACQQKFFEEIYGGKGNGHPGFAVGAKLASPRISEEIREMTHYRQQLIEAERRLLAETYFMAAIYMAETYRYLQHHHIYSSFRHWVRPRYWLHEAQNTEHRLGRQWHNWNQQHPWRNWGKEAGGFVGTLVADARHNIGQPVWAFTKFASLCQAGNLGCAATVSELLQESGVKIPGSAGVYGLVDQLSAAGWQKIKISDKQQFRPGDVVFGVRGPHGHIGIISNVDNNRVLVCDNSSSSGTLKERTIESGGSFTPNGRFAGSLYVMRQSSG